MEWILTDLRGAVLGACAGHVLWSLCEDVFWGYVDGQPRFLLRISPAA